MSLLVPSVLGDEVEVFSTDNKGSVHLCGNDGAGEDAASDRDHAGERAFLVCVGQVLDAYYEFPVSSLLAIRLVGKDKLSSAEVDSPMYEPSMAFLGVLKPNPTSLYQRRPPLPTFLLFVIFDLLLRKM